MKNQFYLLILCLFLIFSACQEDEPPAEVLADLTTNTAQNITGTTVTLGGTIIDEGSSGVYTRGVCWSFNSNPTTNDNSQMADGSGLGSFSVDIDGLKANTIYNVRAFAYNEVGLSYGNNVTFQTTGLMRFTTDIARDIISTRAKLAGEVLDASVSLGSKGFVIGTSSGPTAISDLRISDGLGEGPISITVYDLTPNTSYYARPYSIAGGEYFYGDEISFKTTGFAGTANGVVVYDKGEVTDNWRYLEVSPEQTTSHKWGCQGQQITNTTRDVGAGSGNTHQISTNCNDLDCAAKVASNYIFGGQGDWFLPSIDEAEFILRSLDELKSPLRQNYLWTSTEASPVEAYYMYWNGDKIESFYQNKNFTEPALPVRRY
jgi:hypothetical protein